MINTRALALLVLALLPAGCGDDNNGNTTMDAVDTMADSQSDNGSDGTPDGSPDGTVDVPADVPLGLTAYHADVRALIEFNCNGCHQDGGVAPDVFMFSDPETFVELAEVAFSAIEARRMPPWDLEQSCNSFHGDLTMEQTDIDLISQWIQDGKLMGDPADYVPVEPHNPDVNVEYLEDHIAIDLVPDTPYTPTTTETDDFRCLVVDPGFDTVRHMTGFETLVDNADILHHAVIFKVPASERATLTALEAQDAAPGFECFGDAGVSEQTVVAAWAPGGGRTGFPDRTGIRYEPGDLIVLQMHYNINENGWSADNSGVRFWFMPEGLNPALEATLLFVGNMPFQVPAGVSGRTTTDCDTVYTRTDNDIPPPVDGHTSREVRDDPSLVGSTGCVQQELYFRSPLPVKLWSSFPHMHLKGTDIKIEYMEIDEVNGGADEASSQCLIETRDWDFNWQRAYWYSEPVDIPAEGLIRLTCRYDNTTGTDPVSLGDGSGDEMCLGLLYLTL